MKNKPGLEGSKPMSVANVLLFLGVFWVSMLIIERVLAALGGAAWLKSGPGLLIVSILVAGVAAGAAIYRRPLYRAMSSPQFAVGILTILMASTILGTLILQGASMSRLVATYGQVVARALTGLSLDNIFNSLWFHGFEFLLAASLLLAVYRRRGWKLSQWGMMLAHLGVVVVLAGGLVGMAFGFTGYMDLNEGMAADKAVFTSMGRKLSRTHDLGFTVKLVKFDIDYHEPEFRFVAFKKESDSFKAARTYPLEKLGDWTEVAPGARIKVNKVYPDYYLKKILVEREGGSPGLEISASIGGESESLVLAAGGGGADSARFVDGGPEIRFVWDAPGEEWLRAFGESSPESHQVVFRTPEFPAETVEVEVGGVYPLAGGRYSLKVLAYLPDFIIDMDTRAPSTRSSMPNNPALRVELKASEAAVGKERWLFANMPDFGRQHGQDTGGIELAYQYQPATTPPRDVYLVIGESEEFIHLENGRVTERSALPGPGLGIPGTPVDGYRIVKEGAVSEAPASRSDEFKNPVLEVELDDNGKTAKMRVSAGRDGVIRLSDRETVLEFSKKPDDVEDYFSTLAVIDGGREVLEKKISVNDPLYYGGYYFYQSNYDPEDPTYSGIQVVSDPGLFLVWTGLSMMCAGLVFIFYIKPRLAGRRRGHE